jgi:hypothetical protein
MAGSKTDIYENDVLKATTGQATTILTTTPITPWLALYTVAPTDSTTGTEATGGGYARVSTASKWGTPSAGSVSNTTAISLAQFSGTVSSGSAFVAFAICDASTAGNQLMYGDLTDATKTGSSGDTITFAIGALTLTES